MVHDMMGCQIDSAADYVRFFPAITNTNQESLSLLTDTVCYDFVGVILLICMGR